MKKKLLKKSAALISALGLLTGTILTGCGGSSEGNATAEAGKGNLSIMCWSNESDFAPVLEGFKELYRLVKGTSISRN